MSLTPSSLLARLEELKKWQAKQQERLSQQSSRFENTNNTPSNYDTIQGLSEFDSSVESPQANVKQTYRTVLAEKNSNRESNRIEMRNPTVDSPSLDRMLLETLL
ncbi:hypothetical protein QE152_g3578 [Popillia japonica]|uniref:Uncharacterized protein n=1 Tax=Popillia japonica TaxID=7064 RepID=A0AAW1N1V3_POPJA